MAGQRIKRKSGITLIGLPGSGKSTIGVQLAKLRVMPFIDTDIVLQAHTEMSLQDFLASKGMDALRKEEAKCIRSINPAGCVIATGGSAVYDEPAMAHLARASQIVYLRISYPTMVRRLGDFSARGIAADLSDGLRPMFEERVPLYAQFAEYEIDSEQSMDAVLSDISNIANVANIKDSL